jgi:hypothetical protein
MCVNAIIALQKQFDKLIQRQGGLLNINEVDINYFELFISASSFAI